MPGYFLYRYVEKVALFKKRETKALSKRKHQNSRTKLNGKWRNGIGYESQQIISLVSLPL